MYAYVYLPSYIQKYEHMHTYIHLWFCVLHVSTACWCSFQSPLFSYEINSTLTILNSDWFDLSSLVTRLTHVVTAEGTTILFSLTPEIPHTSPTFLSYVLYVMLILRGHRQDNHHALRNLTDERQVFLNVNGKSPWLCILATVASMSVFDTEFYIMRNKPMWYLHNPTRGTNKLVHKTAL